MAPIDPITTAQEDVRHVYDTLLSLKHDLGLNRLVLSQADWERARQDFEENSPALIQREYDYYRGECAQTGDTYSCAWQKSFDDFQRQYDPPEFKSDAPQVQLQLAPNAGKKIVVPGKLNGNTVSAYVDSGAQVAALPQPLYDEIRGDSKEISIVINEQQRSYSPIDATLLLGGQSFHISAATYFSQISETDPALEGASIVIGQELMSNQVWSIDWTNNEMSFGGDVFKQLQKKDRWETTALIPYEVNPDFQPLYAVQAMVAGQKTLLLFDTGSSAVLQLFEECFLDYSFEPFGQSGTVHTETGSRQAQYYTVGRTYFVGAEKFNTGKVALITPDTIGQEDGNRLICGLVGLGLFSQLNFIVDPETHLLYFSYNPPKK